MANDSDWHGNVNRSHPYYPIYVDIEGRRVVIIGAGDVSARKAASLSHCGADVTIIAPQATVEIEQMAHTGLVTLERKRYEERDLDGAVIAIAATNDRAVNRQIAADCRSRNILVNVIDETESCDFIVPASFVRGSIQIAISTAGKSPALARQLRLDLERIVGPEYGVVNDLFGELREAAQSSLPTDDDRKRFFEELLAQGLIPMLREGRQREAYEAITVACRAAGVAMDERLQARLRT